MIPKRLLIPGFAIFMLALLFLGMGLGREASAETLVVSGDGKGDFLRIQDAVNTADEGDEIRVWDGVYQENVVVPKQLTLIGNGSASTLVDGTVGNGVTITADNCTIQGFSVTGDRIPSHDSAIRLESDGNHIFDNRCFDSHYGIYLDSSRNNTVRNNTLEGCGVALHGYSPGHWNTHVIQTDNSVNGKPVHYLSNQSWQRAPDGAGQLILANCHNFTIEGQNFWNASMGLVMGFCSDIEVSNTSSGGGWDGAWVCHSSKVSFVAVNSSNNACDGLWFQNTVNISVLESEFRNNKVGINFDGSSRGGEVHGCSFLGNRESGVDAISNDSLLVNATGNWWGSLLGPYHSSDNPVGAGDNVTDHVLFSPWTRFLEPGEVFVDVMVIFAGDIVTDKNDLIPGNGCLDVFFGDHLWLEELVYLSEGEPSVENMSWSFGPGSLITGAGSLNFTVGGDIILVDTGRVLEDEVFVSSPPSQEQLHTMVFTVLVEGELYTKECSFMVHPFARHRFVFNLSRQGETLNAEATLTWRGFPGQAVTSFTNWASGKVCVNLDITGSLCYEGSLPENCWLDLNYEIAVYGTQLQDGSPGFLELEITLPFTRSSVEQFGIFDALNHDVAFYRYNSFVSRYGPTAWDSLPGFVLTGNGTEITATLGDISSFEQLMYGGPGDNVLRLQGGLAVKSIWTGEKLPDLVISNVRLDHSHLLIGSRVMITATVECRGDVFVNGQMWATFLGHNDESLAELMVSFGPGLSREQDVSFSYVIDEPLGTIYGNTLVKHRLRVKVDAGELVTESDETNNYGEAELPVVEYRPSTSSSGEDSEPQVALAALTMTLACCLGGLGVFWTAGLVHQLRKPKSTLQGITTLELFLSLPPQSSLVKRFFPQERQGGKRQ